MSHVPSNLTVIIAAYEEGQMVGICYKKASAEIAFDDFGDYVRVFFVDSVTYCPLMRYLER